MAPKILQNSCRILHTHINVTFGKPPI